MRGHARISYLGEKSTGIGARCLSCPCISKESNGERYLNLAVHIKSLTKDLTLCVLDRRTKILNWWYFAFIRSRERTIWYFMNCQISWKRMAPYPHCAECQVFLMLTTVTKSTDAKGLSEEHALFRASPAHKSHSNLKILQSWNTTTYIVSQKNAGGFKIILKSPSEDAGLNIYMIE